MKDFTSYVYTLYRLLMLNLFLNSNLTTIRPHWSKSRKKNIIKCFYAKYIKTSRRITVWKKIAMQMIDKRLSGMHKDILQNGYKQLNNLKHTNEKDMSRQFTEEQIQVADKHMKKCSVFIDVRKI